MKPIRIVLIVLSWAALLGTVSASPTPVRITGNHVNMRARPELNAEVVGQVQRGEHLTAKSMTTNWVEVIPPETIDFWAHRDFLSEGEVVSPRLNIRAGPGINYSVVATVERGDQLVVRGEFGEWVKVEPPKDASLWISSEYVEAITPERPKPLPAAIPPAPKPQPPPPPAIKPPPPKPVPPPEDLDLIPLAGQGMQVEREGTLRQAGFIIGRPSHFRLTQSQGHTHETVCYVKGNEAQLKSLLGKSLLIKGREYWVQGIRHPILVPEQIILRATTY